MIWTKEQLIKNLIKHILKEDEMVYYVQEIENNKPYWDRSNMNYKVSYKPFKDACKVKTEFSYDYYKENFREFLNDNWMEDIKEFKEQNPEATEEQLEAKNEELEKEFDARFNDEELKWYLDEAITELNLEPNEEIDI